MASRDPRLGIFLMALTMLIFATQDALSRHLAAQANAISINWIRFAFFAVVVIAVSIVREGGIREVLATKALGLQILRGLALITQLSIFVYAFTVLGLAEAHAVFSVYPLIVVLMSALILHERVPLVRMLAVGVGFCGVLILLRPGLGVIRVEALLVLFGATIFAIYTVLTRLVSKHDRPETSVAYVALIGFVALSLVVPFFWKPLPPQDWGWMALLCVFGSTAHGLLIKVYQLAEANVVQPLAYLQLAFATGYGVVLFGETPDLWTWIGMTILVLSCAWAARTGQ
jgi:drug/metabolite transporter (DMT)-like permease